MMYPMACDPVGVEDIAERCGVRPIAVRQWRSRGVREAVPFPDPDGMVSGKPWWNWPRVVRWLRRVKRDHLVEKWAKETGRL